jgi:hypothetical protein
MVSNDVTVFDTQSATFSRMKILRDHGVTLTIVVLGSMRAQHTHEGITMLGVAAPWYGLWIIPALVCRTLGMHSYDFITAQDPLKCGYVSWRIAKSMGKPFELQMHGDWFGGYYAKRGLISRIALKGAGWLLRRADVVRAVSSRVAHSLVGIGVAEERVYIAPISLLSLPSSTM